MRMLIPAVLPQRSATCSAKRRQVPGQATVVSVTKVRSWIKNPHELRWSEWQTDNSKLNAVHNEEKSVNKLVKWQGTGQGHVERQAADTKWSLRSHHAELKETNARVFGRVCNGHPLVVYPMVCSQHYFGLCMCKTMWASVLRNTRANDQKVITCTFTKVYFGNLNRESPNHFRLENPVGLWKAKYKHYFW